MRLGFLMLDNSFGQWSQYYTLGCESTWRTKVKKDDFYFRYMGRQPKIVYVNQVLNKVLNSRFKKLGWQYHKMRQQNTTAEGKFLNDSLVQINLEELWSNITTKTISAIEFALKNFEFDYIIRGNSSLYLDTILLEHFLETNLTKVDYAGPVAGSKKFVSGWCIILSRKAAQIIVGDFQKKDALFFDDEAIGIILARNDVKMHAIGFEAFDRIPTSFEVSKALDRGNWIWRFKDDSNGIRISIPAMKLVSEISSNRGISS